MLNLSSLFTTHCSDLAVSHTFLSLCKYLQTPELQTRMVVPSCERSLRGANMVEAISPSFLKKLYYRSEKLPGYVAEKRFLKDLKNFDAAYLWPATSINTLRKVKRLGKPIFLERINCYTGTAKRILDEAYRKLGVEPQHRITSQWVQYEKAEADLADFIFCPSPEVKKSFQEAGVPEDKLILTSYGWEPQRFSINSREKKPSETLTVLFVGTVCVRKGAHLLLRAWERAGIKGRLMLCGKMEPAIAETCKDILSRSDVVHREYNPDIAYAYSKADIFAFPSLEEGSPLVTYEAMAHGLPILASPMGSGSIVRDGIDGMVIAPYDQDAWVEALRKLAQSPELRTQYGASAGKRASTFTWEKVARLRAASILEKTNFPRQLLRV